MDRYTARINLHGCSQRERELNRFKESLKISASTSLSYKNVLINGVQQNIIVDSDDSNKHIKEIKSMPDEKFEVGDYVQWANAFWLITDADYDDEVYTDGKMQQCNWQLTYQKSDGKIIRYWCIDENSTQYNSGETSNKNITLGSSQHMLKIQSNEDTLLLDTPQRLFLDKNIINPTSFKVTQNDTTMYNYGKGICCITLTQDEKKTDKDKLVELDTGEKVWIADYIEPTTLPPVPDGNQSEVLYRISGSTVLKLNIPKEYMVVPIDKSENIPENVYWNIECDFSEKVKTEYTNNAIRLVITDEKLIGKTFVLKAICNGDDIAPLTITISNLF